MRLSVIGAGTWGRCTRRRWRRSATTSSESTSTSARSLASQRRMLRSSSLGCRRSSPRASTQAGCSFTTDMAAAKGAKVHFVGVGTPQVKDGYAADLTYVNAAVDGLAAYLSPTGDIVAGKSTVPVGTAADSRTTASTDRRDAGLEPRVPPRGMGGARTPSTRIDWSLGTESGEEGERAADILREVYHPAVTKGTPLHRDRLGDRRARQGRRERLPGDEDLLHQRDGRDRRGDRRRRHQLADAIGHDARIGGGSSVRASASAAAACRRTSVPSPRAPKSSAAASPSPSCARSTQSTSAAGIAPSSSSSSTRRRRSSRRTSPCSVPPSSRTPTTSVTPRRCDVAVRLHGLGAWVTVDRPCGARERAPTPPAAQLRRRP